MDDKTTIKSAPIWPGPECLRERPARLVMRPTRGSYYPAAVLRLVDGGVWIDGCVYDSRHVMPGVTIALAWEAVRARRERFRARMEAQPSSLERSECLTAFAGMPSPEAFARYLVDRGMLLCTLWLVQLVGGGWPRRARAASYARGYFTATKRVMDEMMGLGDFALRGASPEWAALPFNASEVDRG
jgi:hypothetical protein